MRRWFRLGTTVVVTSLVAGCGERGTIASPQADRLMSNDVVGEAAAALDATGRFVLKPPRATAFPEISASRATTLAVAYLGDYGRLLQPGFEVQRRGPIDVSTIRPCGNVLYADTPYDDASLARVSPDTRRLVGPHWMVSFCNPSGEAVISVGVSALATDEMLVSQAVRLPHPSGNAFSPSGIPREITAFPGGPEQAALAATRATGRRVAAVPELIMRGPPFGPQLARWKIVLESPVATSGASGGTAITTATVFAGYTRSARSPFGLFVGSPNAARTSTLHDRVGRGAAHIEMLQSRDDVPLVTQPFVREGR
jgi:hypothetical protein